MIVHDFYVVGFVPHPPEANPPLIVDANAVLTLASTNQRFQPVAGRRSQVIESRCASEHGQLTPGDPLNRSKSRNIFVVRQSLCISRAKAPDHSVAEAILFFVIGQSE
jgi:hypothetical protein